MSTFAELGLSETLLKALAENKFTTPTEIQLKAIPVLLKNEQDFIGIAHTGTGKTAAFGLPLLQQMDPASDELHAIILCPTRELVQQTARQLDSFAKHLGGVFIRSVYGGLAIETQLEDLQYAAQIIVATPGRLIDLIDRNALDFSFVSHFILDEADEMLNMGFQPDIDFIKAKLPANVRTWLFSATMPEEITKLVETYMGKDHVRIQADPQSALNTDIEHQYLVCKPEAKRDALRFFLRMHENERGLIFCRTKAAVQELTYHLHKNGFDVDELHGDMNQQERDSVMNRFKSGRFRLLVATDLAARGLDVKDLQFVVHYHWPEQREYFTHRSGRTGRAGNKGISVCIVFPKEVKKVNAVANNLGLLFTKIEYIPATDTYADDREESAEEQVSEAKVIIEKPGEMVTFYINMGKAEEVNHKNLVDFLCAEAGVEKKDFGKITVEKKRAYFEIHHSRIRQLVANLKDLVVDGKVLVLTRVEFEGK